MKRRIVACISLLLTLSNTAFADLLSTTPPAGGYSGGQAACAYAPGGCSPTAGYPGATAGYYPAPTYGGSYGYSNAASGNTSGSVAYANAQGASYSGAPAGYFGVPAGYTSSGTDQSYQNAAPQYGNAGPGYYGAQAGYANGPSAGSFYGAPAGYQGGAAAGFSAPGAIYGAQTGQAYGAANGLPYPPNGQPYASSAPSYGAPTGQANGAAAGSFYGQSAAPGYGQSAGQPYGAGTPYGLPAGGFPGSQAGVATIPAGAASPLPGQPPFLAPNGGLPFFQGARQNQFGQGNVSSGNGFPQPLAPGNALDPSGLTAVVNGSKGPMASAPSPLEAAMAEDTVPLDKSLPQQFRVGALTQFGYNFFRPDAVGFAPMVDVPVGPDYTIGAGDHLVLTLWGSIEGTFDLEVNRAGELVLPKVGTVKVEGVSFGQVPGLIKANIGRVFKDFHLSVAMGRVRLIKVYLVGEVAAPGDYNLSSLSTLINALSAAGGPTKNGSLRNIQIKRNGRLVETVDLYDFFLKGDKGKDIRLQPGDTILVPVLGQVAGIAGNVRRPGIYELKGEKSLKELIQLADGINPTGYLQRVQLLRVKAHDKKLVRDLNLDPKDGKSTEQLTSSIALKDLDLVKIFPIESALRGYVRLDGYVLRPGDYAYSPGMRVSSLLGKDNLLPEYYAAAGQITRLQPPDYHPEVRYFDVSAALKGGPAGDPELNEFDTVHLFSRWEMEEMPTVRISGEVQRPGIYRLFENMTVRDLLAQAGNPRLSAYLKNAEITRMRRNGDAVTSYSITVNLTEAINGKADNVKLEPFDELTVRRLPNWSEETDRYILLKGEFVFPGVYPIYKGEHLSSVIKRAGGFTDKAYLPAAKFTRVQVRELQQKRMDELLAKAEADITKQQGMIASTATTPDEVAAAKASLDGLMKSVEMLKQTKAEGRLVIKLAQPEQMKEGPYDVEAVGGDVLEVPPNPKMVSVLGQVYNPTSFVYQPGATVRSYLKEAGGGTRDAETDDIYLVKADGSVISRQESSGGFFGIGGFFSRKVDSGDTIIVPQRTEQVAWMRNIKDIATIIGQAAVTAGVLLAAGL